MTEGSAKLVKEKLDLVDFLKGYLTVQSAGRNFKANCPFHKEKTPSFMISPERQTWHCFGCGLGGDIFAFLMRHDNLEFGEALKVLADKAGIELQRTSPMEYQQFGILYDLNEAAKNFFKQNLQNSKRAMDYLLERGLRKETIEEFELGFAPNEPESLILHFINLGYAPDQVIRAGLAIKTERGMQLDRFRGRIMFPIHNHMGKVVGFTGRILPEFDKGDMGKYVNSPETPIFLKSKLLYGFWKSKNAVRESGFAFLVEGQMDFLMSYQIGIKNAIASSGTALTPDHLRLLRRYTEKIILSFDNDEAGWNAAERAIDLCEANDFNVRVAALKEFKDPADAASRDPKALQSAISDAQPAIQSYFERYLTKDPRSYLDRDVLKRLRLVLQKIKYIASAVQRNFWIKELANYTGLEEKAVREEAERIETPLQETVYKTEDAEKPGAEVQPLNRWELVSRDFISAGLKGNALPILAEFKPYLTETCRQAFDALHAGQRKVEDPSLDQIIESIILRSDFVESADLEDLKSHLKREYVKKRREELAEAVRKAEKSGNEADTREALEALNQLSTI